MDNKNAKHTVYRKNNIEKLPVKNPCGSRPYYESAVINVAGIKPGTQVIILSLAGDTCLASDLLAAFNDHYLLEPQ